MPFARVEVEYLGFQVTLKGLEPTKLLVRAVEEFPVLTSLKELQQFWGWLPIIGDLSLSLPKWLIRYITLHNVPFHWDTECQAAFDNLKIQLVPAPVLAYPKYRYDFVLETDASYVGLGAVLPQLQDDGKLHPLSYASRGLTALEKNYSVTELETLAVVWAIGHYRAEIVWTQVKIYTDHSAVKAVLGATNLSGKHACWWTKVYANGLQSADIVYCSGKENTNADALLRTPQFQPDQTALPEEVTVHEEILAVQSKVSQPFKTITELLEDSPVAEIHLLPGDDLAEEQRKDSLLAPLIQYLTNGSLPQ